MSDIISLAEQKKKIIDQIKNAQNLQDVETVQSEYNSRQLAEEAEPLLKRMNLHYAFVNSVGGRPMVKSLIYNEYFRREIIEFISPDSLMLRHANETAEGYTSVGNDKYMPLGKWWLGHVHRKTYETVTFEPDRPTGEYITNGKVYFNLWEGFTVEPKKGNWSKTRKHIWKILCNQHKKKFRYVMRWFAWAIQNPGDRAEVAIIFKGKKGAGKGFILQNVVKLFGRHGLVIANREHLVGKHNDHLESASFLYADEAYHPGDKEVEGILKNIITEPSLTVEPKFRGLKVGRNCLHIAMATNSDWVIPATEDERRYFINEVDNRYAKGQTSDAKRQDYFDELYKEMNQDGLAAFLWSMKNMNLKGWHPRRDIPETEELRRQIEMSLPKAKYSFIDILKDGVFPGEKIRDEYRITNKKLLDYIHEQDPSNRTVTVKSLSKLLQELGVTAIRNNGRRYYAFPELGELRKAWSIKITKYDEWALDETWVVDKAEY